MKLAEASALSGLIAGGLATLIVPYLNYMDRRAEYYREELDLPSNVTVDVSFGLCQRWYRCEIIEISYPPKEGERVRITQRFTVERVIYKRN